MLIDVYAHGVCPWCCIGERRLEKALDKRLDRDANPLRAYRADPLQRRGGSKNAPRRERSPQGRARGRAGQGVLEEALRRVRRRFGSDRERRRRRSLAFYEFEMALREEGLSDFVYDEENDLLRFPDGRFAFSREGSDVKLLRERGYDGE